MDRAMLKEFGFKNRNEALTFLNKLWKQEKVECLQGNERQLLSATIQQFTAKKMQTCFVDGLIFLSN